MKLGSLFEACAWRRIEQNGFEPRKKSEPVRHQACHAARFIKPRRVIPMHYGTFPALTGRPEDLARRLEDDEIEVWTLKQGETVEW